MQIFCTGTMDLRGHYSNDGQVNLINLGNSTGPSGVNGNYLFGSNGGGSNAGNNGSAGANLSFGYGGDGGKGGNNALGDKTGGAKGVVNLPAGSAPIMGGINQLWLPQVMQSGLIPQDTNPFNQKFGGGAGGGAGAGVVIGNFQAGAGGDGGGVLGLFARFITGDGTGKLSCDGAPGNRGDWSSPAGGGGGGGGGGILLVITTTANWYLLVLATCNPGAGGLSTTGQPGVAGNPGSIAYIVVQ
jgi:hypothetical protein